MTGVSPRIMPLAREDWSDEVKQALTEAFPLAAPRFFSTGPDALPVPSALTTMLHHPELAGKFLAYNSVLLTSPSLGARIRELVVLRVAYRCQSEYEWLQHAQLATRCGVTGDEIAAISKGISDSSWAPNEMVALTAADELLEDFVIADGSWTALTEYFDTQQCIELIFTVGTYVCLAMAFKSFVLPLDPALDAAAKTHPLPPLEQ